MVLISPSIIAGDFLNLAQEISALEKASADLIHIDVMDGHFVPNLTLGPNILRAIKRVASIPLDVHLMISNPLDYIDTYISSGADYLTIHVESAIHIERIIKHIKALNSKAGIALNPSTHESALEYIVKDLDLVLIMSVNPGFSGQIFLESALKKIRAIKSMLEDANNHQCIISVDGGINNETAALCRKAGATCMVAGSYIFKSADYGQAIKNLRGPEI